jgi:hypothetical protein
MKISTEPGRIFLQLVSDSWSTGNEAAAVAEITARGTSASKPKITMPIGVNNPPLAVPLDPGDYTVRMYLPSGDVLAESVTVGGEGENEEHVGFDLARSPHEWLSSETALGAVQRLPNAARAKALEAWRGIEGSVTSIENTNLAGRVTQAISDYSSGFASLERVSGRERVSSSMSGWCRYSKVDPKRPLPEGRLPTKELLRWWTGTPSSGQGVPLEITNHDDRNAKLSVSGGDELGFDLIAGQRRAFAAVIDPTKRWHYAVFPAGWVRTSRNSPGTPAQADLLMTVVIESVMRASEEAEEAARWRCSPAVSDVEAMTYLGFLYSGQASAAEAMLDQATELLFEKTLNPVAAAAGAFGLLAFTPPESGSRRASWQQWIRNLCTMFPQLPDGAIARAQLYLRFGEGKAGVEELDVEMLRGYVLDAVRRGLPYLSYAIRPLSEMLLLLVSDDQEHKRKGPQVEDTRRARRLVQQLERLVAPGAFFTVLETGEMAP